MVGATVTASACRDGGWGLQGALSMVAKSRLDVVRQRVDLQTAQLRTHRAR